MKAKLFLTGLAFCLILFTGHSNMRIVTEKSNIMPEVTSSLNSAFKVLPSSYNQVQTWIATHPLNPMIMAASSITDVYPGGYCTGAFITTNGGLNWSGTNSIRDINNNIIVTIGDPSITIDKNGVIMIVYTAPSPGGGFDLKAGISYSTNNGLYWSQLVYVPGVDTCDKIICTTDNTPSSPYFGMSYIAYSERRKGGIYFSRTTNGGVNWDTAKRICPPIKDARTGASIVTGPQGEIFVSWPYYDTLSSNNYIGFAKSTDGGFNWSAKDTAILVNLVSKGHRINLVGVKLNGLPVMHVDKSGGPRHGTIYVSAMEKSGTGSPALDNYDIIIHNSTNNGVSWNASQRVNQDNTGTLKYQFFPALNIDKYGGINVFYYDTRNTASNDSFEVYLSRSVNGGYSFQDMLISEHKFKLKPIIPDLFGVPGYIGSYIGVASSDETIYPLWFDNSSGNYQAWSTPVNIGTEVKAIPQGLYNSSSGMLNKRDSLKVYLRNSTSPFLRTDSATGILDSMTFKLNTVFQNASAGNYYLEISDQNSLQTWSSVPLSYSACTGLNYDFTLSSSQAFGEVMIMVNSSWCIYSADINKDGQIDLNDLSTIFNDVCSFVSGNVYTDVNGDGLVNLNDISICFNNSSNFVRMMTP